MTGREPVGFGRAAGMLVLGIVAFIFGGVVAVPLVLSASNAGPVIYLVVTTAGALGGGTVIWRRSTGSGRYFGLGLMAGWALVTLLVAICLATFDLGA